MAMPEAQVPEVLRAVEEEETELVPRADPRSKVISIDPERMSGTPCFVGTRVPIRHLFDYLISGDNFEEFLEGFPGVTQEQCEEVLNISYDKLLEGLPYR